MTLPGDIRFKLGVDALAGPADSGDLRDVLVSVDEAAADAGVGFAFALDELHNLSSADYEALVIGLHRAKQKSLPVSFVAAGLPLIAALTGDATRIREAIIYAPRRPARIHGSALRALHPAPIRLMPPLGLTGASVRSDDSG